MKNLNKVAILGTKAVINNDGNAITIPLEEMGMAVYGTLRKGDYNYDRFNLGEYYSMQGTDVIVGMSMQDLGFYPCIFLDDTSKKGITVEYYLPKSKDSLLVTSSIIGMESGAGYKTAAVERAGKWYLLFYFEGPLAGFAEVENGDWVNWKERKTKDNKGVV